MSQSTIINVPVASVNAKIGVVVLTNVDVGAAATVHTHNGYALTDHTHTEYAGVNHTHTEYAPVIHTHSGYALSEHTHTESNITDLGSYIEDATADDSIYGRKNNTWVEVSPGGIGEAPVDSTLYGRQDATWVEVPLSSVNNTVYSKGTTDTWADIFTQITNDFPNGDLRSSTVKIDLAHPGTHTVTSINKWKMPAFYNGEFIIGSNVVGESNYPIISVETDELIEFESGFAGDFGNSYVRANLRFNRVKIQANYALGTVNKGILGGTSDLNGCEMKFANCVLDFDLNSNSVSFIFAYNLSKLTFLNCTINGNAAGKGILVGISSADTFSSAQTIVLIDNCTGFGCSHLVSGQNMVLFDGVVTVPATVSKGLNNAKIISATSAVGVTRAVDTKTVSTTTIELDFENKNEYIDAASYIPINGTNHVLSFINDTYKQLATMAVSTISATRTIEFPVGTSFPEADTRYDPGTRKLSLTHSGTGTRRFKIQLHFISGGIMGEASSIF